MEQPTCRTCLAIDLRKINKGKALCRMGGPSTWKEVRVDQDFCFNHPRMREIVEHLPLPPPSP